ncbi:mechanosensitive ion channel domain-containing protein [uncultured Jannaschia sp.]|uniref:mechanosensitive ion channel family protein n=1 Tax=uncultured Jannaschia sp. TaxID=293347 RepID=UPI00262F4116|nr:mechanosensitive ion channel domain-containing protein [uncultured Jannaschia sp.]
MKASFGKVSAGSPSLSPLIGFAMIQLLLMLLTLGGPAFAQMVPEVATEEEPAEAAVDPLGRDTPRGMVDGLIDALAEADMARAAQYLDLSAVSAGLREQRGPEFAAALETALDRLGNIQPSYLLSIEPEGMTTDGLPVGEDIFARVRTGDGTKGLTAHRVPGPEGAQIWLVTPDTLNLVRRLSWTASDSLIDRLTPAAWRALRFAGVPVSHWAGIGALALLSFGIAYGVAIALFWIAARAWSPLRTGQAIHVGRAILLPIGLLLACVLFMIGSILAGISIVARAHVVPIVEIVAWLALAWLVWRAVDAMAHASLDSMTRRGKAGAISVVILLRRVGKVAVFAVAAVAVFNSLGVNLTGWIAAFGLGGLALALGAQKTIEHFVGSITLVADQPVRVGDFCQVDGLLGTVEDIGIRSTRIRTLERTLVTIPNGIMSSATIENYASRDQYLFKRLLSLRYETTPDQIRAVVWRLRGMLEADDRVTEDPARVRFLAFGASSLDIEIFAYVLAVDYNEFLGICEELNLTIMEIVVECGTSFAFPSRTVYIEDRSSKSAQDNTDRAAERPMSEGRA